ncbi:MAG: methyltransferase domain-containing protein, partial [Gammaproteobacteria bacterium]|nr:methyltransferase domain-containing protein [Gammaproteobacteria bacterium]
MNKSDEIYASKRASLKDFAFGPEVVRVFPDMVRRSVPGYETLVFMIGCIAGMRAKPNSNVYDLGCSLGQSTLMMHSRIDCPGVHYVCVDNSQDMLKGCQENLDSHISQNAYTLIDDDIQSVPINDASVVV